MLATIEHKWGIRTFEINNDKEPIINRMCFKNDAHVVLVHQRFVGYKSNNRIYSQK